MDPEIVLYCVSYWGAEGLIEQWASISADATHLSNFTVLCEF